MFLVILSREKKISLQFVQNADQWLSFHVQNGFWFVETFIDLLADVLEDMRFLPYMSLGPFILYAHFCTQNKEATLSDLFFLTSLPQDLRNNIAHCLKSNKMKCTWTPGQILYFWAFVSDTILNNFVYGKCMTRDLSDFISLTNISLIWLWWKEIFLLHQVILLSIWLTATMALSNEGMKLLT